MKRLLTGLLALCLATAPATSQENWRDEAVAYLLKEDAKTVVEAMFTQDISLWISVRDDGSRRDGLAEYFCLVLQDFMPADDMAIITIWDAAAMASDELKELGKSTCDLE